MHATDRNTPFLVPLLVAAFFFSGLCGLIYEVVWSRMLYLIFGSTTYAVSTVIGVYMLGLAAGSYLCGKLIPKITCLLRTYAILEFLIGVYAFLFIAILSLIDVLHSAIFPFVFESPLLLNGSRILLSFAVLIIPTTLMGGTLPLLSQHLTRKPQSIGKYVGWLYFINTIGAAAGCFLGAFVLIPRLGLHSTIWLAAAVNIGIGLLVLVCARKESAAGEQNAQSGVVLQQKEHIAPGQANRVIWAFACTGFLALIFEVAWTRSLILVFGSSVYSFATMLATFLTGLALGSMIVSRFADRFKHPVAIFCVFTILMGLFTLLTTPLIGQLPDLSVRLYDPHSTTWYGIILMQFGMCFAVMFPTTLMSGALFPLVSRIAMSRPQLTGGQTKGRTVGRTVGDVYAYNTIGGILGSVLTGFILIPYIGIEHSLLAGGAVCMAVGGMVLFTASTLRTRQRLLSSAAVLLCAVFLPLSFPSWDTFVMNMGVYRNTAYFIDKLQQGGESDLKGLNKNVQTLFYKEGHAATVAVNEQKDGVRLLHINGKADGSSGLDSFTQILCGILPLFYQQNPESALVVGLATGMTVGSTLFYPMKEVDCIEIAPTVVEASHYFDQFNNRPLENPNLHLHVLDARTWLMAMPKSYNTIISEPSNPWQTGNANLFTSDFYQLVKKRLQPGGVFCQWLPIYDVKPKHYKILLNTLKKSFKYVNLWLFLSDTVLIASDQPLQLYPQQVKKILSVPRAQELLAQLEIHNLNDLLSFFYLDTLGVERFLMHTPLTLNTDAFPIIEFSSPKFVHTLQLQDKILYPLFRLSAQSRLPVQLHENRRKLQAEFTQHRIRLYTKVGFPKALLLKLFGRQ